MSNVIEVTNLHKAYGASIAVADVSFSVKRGEIFGIVGPNGAGKTTTVETIIGTGLFAEVTPHRDLTGRPRFVTARRVSRHDERECP